VFLKSKLFFSLFLFAVFLMFMTLVFLFVFMVVFMIMVMIMFVVMLMIMACILLSTLSFLEAHQLGCALLKSLQEVLKLLNSQPIKRWRKDRFLPIRRQQPNNLWGLHIDLDEFGKPFVVLVFGLG
jgi:hypothetical protein